LGGALFIRGREIAPGILGAGALQDFAIIEDGSTWNETFLNLYNDRDLGRES
jgi:hypothetical protein